jgi:hypothetical protein
MTPLESTPVRRGHRRVAILLTCAVAWLSVANSCDEKSGAVCDRPGDEWCDRNTIVSCIDGETDFFVRQKPVLEQGIDCDDYGGTCVEWDENSGASVAGCAVPGSTCAAVGVGVCLSERRIATCEPPALRVMYGCGGYYCQTLPSGNGTCAYALGSCAAGEVLCAADGSAYYECDEPGVWTGIHPCLEGEICSQTSATEAHCLAIGK